LSSGWFDPLWVALWTLFICALPSAISKVVPTFVWNHPAPSVLDEFSYLLAGDTFAHGRLTNPTPAMWQHFETYYVLMHPTYMSKFPPGQGMALAAGEVLGDPLYGVWIAMALACAAVTWAIAPWLGRGWALAMGLVLPMLPVIHWWSQTYWGGAVQMLGGALVIGAIVRAMRTPSLTLGMTAGAGAVILSVSRPFEGLLLCGIVGTALLVKWIRARQWSKHFVIGGVLVGAIAVPVNLYYNWRVSTDPLTMPYKLHSQQYARVPQFYWQAIAPPKPIRDPHLRWFYQVHETTEVQFQTSGVGNFLRGVWFKLSFLAGTFLNPRILAIVLLAALLAWKQRLAWLAWLIVLVLPLVHMSLTPWLREHYLAPAMAAWIALLGLGAQVIWKWGMFSPRGHAGSLRENPENPASPRGLNMRRMRIGQILVLAMLALHLYLACNWAIEMNREGAQTSGAARAKFIATLEAEPGDDLVLVDYPPDKPGDPPGYKSIDDWVFNDADIDHSPVIFAHWMSDAENAEILNYYSNRNVYYVRLFPGGTQVRRIR
jgi:hypothetical protein